MSQRFLLYPHTRSLTDGRAYLLCVYMRVFVLYIMILLNVAQLKPVMVCVCFSYTVGGGGAFSQKMT